MNGRHDFVGHRQANNRSLDRRKESKKEKELFYNKIRDFFDYYLPCGLSLDTLKDICYCASRECWDCVTEAKTPSGKRLKEKLNEIVKPGNVSPDLCFVVDTLFNSLDKFSTDPYNPSLDSIPEDKIKEFLAHFQRYNVVKIFGAGDHKYTPQQCKKAQRAPDDCRFLAERF